MLSDKETIILNPSRRIEMLVESASFNRKGTIDIPLSRYYDLLQFMFDFAGKYWKDSVLEKAFVLFLRFSSLVLEELPRHKDFEVGDPRKKKLDDEVQVAMDNAESIKVVLAEVYQEEAVKCFECIVRREELDHILADYVGNVEKAKASDLVQVVREGLRVQQKGKLEEEATPSEAEHMAVPADLVNRYVSFVGPELTRNEDVVGILCGVQIRNRQVITHILIPKQKVVLSCTEEGLDDLADVSNPASSMYRRIPPLAFFEACEMQVRLGLTMMGWIHSHIPHGCFLSRPDMLIQYAFSTLFPRALGIVFSPNVEPTEQVSMFCLTEQGLTAIGNCSLEGDPSVPIYMNAEFVKKIDHQETTIIDLREK